MGQILLDANYIESLTEKSEDFLDLPSLYKFCAVSLNANDDPDVITRMYTSLNLHCTKFLLNFLYLTFFLITYDRCTFCIDHDQPLCMSENTSPVSHSDFQLDINISKNTAHISRQPQKINYTKGK